MGLDEVIDMKVRVACRDENREAVIQAVNQGNLELDEHAEYVILEAARVPSTFLTVKERGEFVRIPMKDVLYLESLHKDVIVHTQDGCMNALDTLSNLELLLSEKGFLRVHKSYIVQIDKIKRIRVSLNTKFLLVMENLDTVEVSRTYYYRFKERLGI